MGSESNGGRDRNWVPVEEQGQNKGGLIASPYHLDKFALFETPSNFYLIGRDEGRTRWRVLKIGRSEPSKLIIYEDPTVFSFDACKNLLKDIDELNKLTGGRKFVTTCYGIVGFVRFLGPYYILLITKRKEIGRIGGHPIFAISEHKLIPIPPLNGWSLCSDSAKENRYKKLLWLVDIRKDFFFSYSYPIMHSLQKNLSSSETGQSFDRKIFIWNEHLTHQIRNHLKNTLWTVALVHGFFKQAQLSNCGKTFSLTLFARRSSQFAGTRFQKRGVDEKGQAANDVEIEQIVCEESADTCPYNVTSVVQNRGSLPIRWSQKPSCFSPKPDILFPDGCNSYEGTQLHFRKLRIRYGDPIIILNLTKTSEKKQRETLLYEGFRKAVNYINKNLPKKDQLEFLSLDLDAFFKREGTNVLPALQDFATNALRKVGLLSCQMPHSLKFRASFDLSYCWIDNSTFVCSQLQQGILRTNCLDSLDRTNVAQYVYSLVALGHQLYTLKITESQELDFSHSLAYELMGMYEAMGDSLAQQYGGSAAHSKIFSKSRGHCKAAIQFQEFMKSVQRHYSNSFMDAVKQKAIDVFLGRLLPEFRELSSSKCNLFEDDNIRKENDACMEKKSRRTLKRSKSETKTVHKKCTDMGNPIDSSEISDSESDSSDARSLLKRSQSDGEIFYYRSSIMQGQINTSDLSGSESHLKNSRHNLYVPSVRVLYYLDRQWFGCPPYEVRDEFDPPHQTGYCRP